MPPFAVPATCTLASGEKRGKMFRRPGCAGGWMPTHWATGTHTLVATRIQAKGCGCSELMLWAVQPRPRGSTPPLRFSQGPGRPPRHWNLLIGGDQNPSRGRSELIQVGHVATGQRVRLAPDRAQACVVLCPQHCLKQTRSSFILRFC